MRRARAIRRAVLLLVATALIVVAAWGGWALFALREFGTSARSPLVADHATSLLEHDSDLVLVVARSSDKTSFVSVLKTAASPDRSWLLEFPEVALPSSDATVTRTFGQTLDAEGRRELIRSVTRFVGHRFGHYLEIDLDACERVLDLPRGSAAATAAVGEETTAAQGDAAVPADRATRIAGGRLSACAVEYARVGNERFAELVAPRLLGRLSGAVISDIGAGDLSALVGRIARAERASKAETAVAPVETIGHMRVLSRTLSRRLLQHMAAGEAFGRVEAAVPGILPGAVSVTIHNGAGKGGVASQASRILTREGYRVGFVGNANQFVYDKTLVVYEKDRRAAEAVAADLGIGKVVAGRGMYSFTTAVLVIVGKDWPDAP